MELTEIKRLYVIELRNKTTINSDQTIRSYESAVNKFLNENNRVYRMSEIQVKGYLALIRETYSDSYYNIIGSAIKILFESVLRQPRKMKWFKAIKSKKTFHNIITNSEFMEMGRRCTNSKSKLIHVLLYSTGIRLGELLDIKLSDIDWDNNRIFIRSVKGGKNRFVPVHDILRRYIIKYLKEWNLPNYLLCGQNGGKYSRSSVQAIIKRTSNGKYTPHDFRHKYLTELIEHDNVFSAQEQAGHRSLSSTLTYYHMSIDKLNSLFNPLNVLTA